MSYIETTVKIFFLPEVDIPDSILMLHCPECLLFNRLKETQQTNKQTKDQCAQSPDSSYEFWGASDH